MSALENARLARIPHDAYNARDFDRALAILGDGFEMRNVATGQLFRGVDGMRDYMQGWATAFPDSRVEVRNTIVSDDGFAVEFIGRGMQTGPLVTPQGTIAPTNREVAVEFCEVYEVRDGKLTSGRMYFDATTMMGQLGLTQNISSAREATAAR